MNQTKRAMLEHRFPKFNGTITLCEKCGGTGYFSYSNTGTWLSENSSIPMIVGQAFTYDVCDKCWGSGDKDRPWTNLFKLYEEGKL